MKQGSSSVSCGHWPGRWLLVVACARLPSIQALVARYTESSHDFASWSTPSVEVDKHHHEVSFLLGAQRHGTAPSSL